MEQEDEPQTLYDFLCILDDKATALSQISSPDEFKPAAAQLIHAAKAVGVRMREDKRMEEFDELQKAVANLIKQISAGGDVTAAMDDLDKEITWLKNSKPARVVVEQELLPQRVVKVPILVITGFLGAGKTTLLNYILSANHGKRIAIIENEFGEVGIDEDLIKKHILSVNTKQTIFELNNGCLCCTVRGDLMETLITLLSQRDKFDYVMLETTGLADPAPIVQTFFMDQRIKNGFRLEGIVTVVDAKHVLAHLDEERPEGAVNETLEQLIFADRVLLNKIDLVNESEIAAVRKRIGTINPMAKVIPTSQSKVNLDEVLDIGAFDVTRLLAADPNFLQDDPEDEHPSDCSCSEDEEEEEKKEGRKDEKEQGEGPEEKKDEPKKEEKLHKEKNHKHKDHKHHEHKDREEKKNLLRGRHDAEISSVGLVHRGNLNGQKLDMWISALLQIKGKELYRMKGIVAIQGVPHRIVFHGIHHNVQAQPAEKWQSDAERISKLVFIGKNLPRAMLQEEFKQCIASAEDLPIVLTSVPSQEAM